MKCKKSKKVHNDRFVKNDHWEGNSRTDRDNRLIDSSCTRNGHLPGQIPKYKGNVLRGFPPFTSKPDKEKKNAV